ncbi:4750_t:CDS:1, partial [Acaulospora colombiana]
REPWVLQVQVFRYALEELLGKLALNCETIEKDISYQLYEVGAYVRMNVARGLEDMRLQDWNRLGKVTSSIKQYLESTSVVKLLDTTVKFVTERPGVMSLNQLSKYPHRLKRYHSSPLHPPACTIRIRCQAKGPPAVSPYFVVRKEGWQIMEQKLLGPRAEGLNVFVISGMGGCGKTQMVSYFVQAHHQK